MRWRIMCFVGGVCVGSLLNGLPTTTRASEIPKSLHLDLNTCVETIAEYNVHHIDVGSGLVPWNGLTFFDEKTIYIANGTDLFGRRHTAIHELFHVFKRLAGMEDKDEPEIEEATDRTYAELFSK